LSAVPSQRERHNDHNVRAHDVHGMHADARRCTQMHADARRCTQMHADARRCTQMHEVRCPIYENPFERDDVKPFLFQ
jgi:hypothetical protein